MIFYLSRTSADGDQQPCEGAQREGDNWVIEIDDLDALMALAEREGKLVVSPKSLLTYPWLDIYDYYRE